MTLGARISAMQNVTISTSGTGNNSNVQSGAGLAYMNSPQRLNAFLAWEHDFLNPKMPTATYTPVMPQVSPQQWATLGYLQNEIMKIQAEANIPPMPKYGDSVPYGMTRQLWMFPYDMYTGGMNFFQPMSYGMGMNINPFMTTNMGGLRVNIPKARASASVSASGSLLGAPFSAIGGGLQGLGDALLDLSGWSCSA